MSSKIKFLLAFFMVFVFSASQFLATTFYVNGAIGKDENDGQSIEKSVKSISKALLLAKSHDNIEVEGKNETKNIVYTESIIIPKDKSDISFKGKNNPIIDGKDLKSNNNVAFLIYAEDTKIIGFNIKNFLSNSIIDLKIKGGAGIAISNKVTNTTISDNIIESCNYGIYSIENQYLNVNNNVIKNIDKTVDAEWSGSGIVVISNGEFIQKNMLGVKGGNKISDFENYGIFIGAKVQEVLVDFSEIKNNIIGPSKKGFGMGIYNLEGIISISNNTFIDNYIALDIDGNNLDVNFENNIFKGSISDTEIRTTNKYSGELLWSVWKEFGNVFEKKTFSKIENNQNTISDSNGTRFIRTTKDAVEKDGSVNSKIIE